MDVELEYLMVSRRGLALFDELAHRPSATVKVKKLTDGMALISKLTQNPRGLKHFHKLDPPLVHQDFKLGCILVDDDEQVRFGLSLTETRDVTDVQGKVNR